MKVCRLLLLGLLLALSSAGGPADGFTAAPQDWPLFRGNSHQTGVASSSLPEQLEIRWKFQAKDSIESTAAIWNGTVYVGSFDENLYALDLATGAKKWVYKAGPIKAAVSVRDGAVYVGNTDGIFHCVDALTGKKRWTYETGAEITSGANFAGDEVLFGCADESLYCLSKDGKERWKFQVPGGPVMGSPAIVDQRTFAAGCDKTLHVINVTNGKEQGTKVDLGGPVGATVAVVGDELYVGTMSNQVLAINWKKGEILWTFEAARGPKEFFSSPAATDHLVIVGSRDKRIHALDRKSGQEVWNYATKRKVDGSPVVAGQRVFVGSSDGNLYVLDLAKGKELARFELGDEIVASPAVAQDCLVIGATKHGAGEGGIKYEGVVYCLGAKK